MKKIKGMNGSSPSSYAAVILLLVAAASAASAAASEHGFPADQEEDLEQQGKERRKNPRKIAELFISGWEAYTYRVSGHY